MLEGAFSIAEYESKQVCTLRRFICRGFPYETSTTCKRLSKIYVKRAILRSITLSRDKSGSRRSIVVNSPHQKKKNLLFLDCFSSICLIFFIPLCPSGPCFWGILQGKGRPLTFDFLKSFRFHIQLNIPTGEADDGNTLGTIFDIYTHVVLGCWCPIFKGSVK